MSSLTILGIAPFLDFAGLLMFVEKISIYLLIGVTLYFSRFSKQDKHNSEPNADLSTRDIFNEILATRDARLTSELANRDARFVTELGRIATEFESINRSITTLQTEVNQRHSLVQSTNRRGSDQQSEVSSSSTRSSDQKSEASSSSTRSSDQQSEASSSSTRSSDQQSEASSSAHSSNSSNSSQRFANIISVIRGQFSDIVGKYKERKLRKDRCLDR